jgi:hypothetical protein
MKRIYIKPEVETSSLLFESYFCAKSTDGWDLGTEGGENEEEGPIGGGGTTGPSHTGSKENTWDLWDDGDFFSLWDE